MLDGSGVRITGRAELAEIVRRGAAAGFPVAVHAIGDGANREALDAFEETRDAGRRRGCGLASSTRSSSRPRTSSASRRSASPARCSSRTRRPTATSPTATGPARPTGVRVRSLLDSGAVVANGSDAPIEELDPLAGIRAGVRRTIDGRNAWHPEQALSVEQAFRATCVAPAWLAGEERRARTLVPGRARPTWSSSTATRGDDLGVEVVQRVAIEHDQVGGVARKGSRAAVLAVRARRARHSRVERLVDGERLLRMPGVALVDRAAHARADPRERVELLDRRIAAVRDDGARVEQRPERVGAVGLAGPVAVGEIAVGRGGELHRAGDAERGEAGEILGREELRVLDPRAQPLGATRHASPRTRRAPRGSRGRRSRGPRPGSRRPRRA